MPTKHISRLRVFAGPNGSGKTTLCTEMEESAGINLYKLVSADDIFELLPKTPELHLRDYHIDPSNTDLRRFIDKSTYSQSIKKSLLSATINKRILDLTRVTLSPYNVALISAFLRASMVKKGISFSFETVFSHESKVKELKKAKKSGYRNYLYFIGTDNIEVNVARVRQRVREKKGHDVPEAKIRSRYVASLDNIVPAMAYVYRAYIFDNSHEVSSLLAELNPQGDLLLKTKQVPRWFDRYVLQKIEKP